MASITPSYKSYLSTYTPSQASFFVLPVTAEAPNEMQRAQDNWGFAFCSLFCNPIFGIAAILLAGNDLFDLYFFSDIHIHIIFLSASLYIE
jgi:hypothetical protein